MPRQARAATVPLFHPGREPGLRAAPAPTPCPAQPGPPRGCHLAGGAARIRRPCRRLRASCCTTAPGGGDNLTRGRRRPRLGLPAESSRLGMNCQCPCLPWTLPLVRGTLPDSLSRLGDRVSQVLVTHCCCGRRRYLEDKSASAGAFL